MFEAGRTYWRIEWVEVKICWGQGKSLPQGTLGVSVLHKHLSQGLSSFCLEIYITYYIYTHTYFMKSSLCNCSLFPLPTSKRLIDIKSLIEECHRLFLLVLLPLPLAWLFIRIWHSYLNSRKLKDNVFLPWITVVIVNFDLPTLSTCSLDSIPEVLISASRFLFLSVEGKTWTLCFVEQWGFHIESGLNNILEPWPNIVCWWAPEKVLLNFICQALVCGLLS